MKDYYSGLVQGIVFSLFSLPQLTNSENNNHLKNDALGLPEWIKHKIISTLQELTDIQRSKACTPKPV